MSSRIHNHLWAAAFASAFACAVLSADLDPRTLSGGAMTTAQLDLNAYSMPAPSISAEHTLKFSMGREAFQQRWVPAPLIGGPWGLGPTSNGDRCVACHENNGRGAVPDSEGQPLRSMLVRLSMPGENEFGGPVPHPHYGEQLNHLGTPERAPGEGTASVKYEQQEVSFADGEKIVLRKPQIIFDKLGFGPLGEGVMISARVAPPVFGLGLLEAIPEATLLQIAEVQREHGISGRPNRVWDVAGGKPALGRFGLKANQPNIKQQIAVAFHNDLGVTSEYFAAENCPQVQKDCRLMPPGGNPELSTKQIEAIELYLRALAVPARRNADDAGVQRGERLFTQAQCAVCHVPEVRTEAYPALPIAANQVIRPFTDLLLHDMGDALADGRPDFKAEGREWRTAPLWGLGLSDKVNGNSALLHDGRARSVAEAILWHGGEAEQARDAFRSMPREDREALVKFVESI